jgi:hypothetical protein
MANDPIADLYNRYVKPKDMGKRYVLADDTDPGFMMTDHVDSPMVCAAQATRTVLDQYKTQDSTVLVPFSKEGPTLIMYWQCEKPEVIIHEGECLRVKMPYGRLAVLYRGDDGKLVMRTYYAW